MGEFCFWRKLLTAPERVCIPNVVPSADSPHVDACDPSIGSRTGIGVDDVTGPWVDLLGNVRDGRPDMGAIEYVPTPDGGSDASDAGGPGANDPSGGCACRAAGARACASGDAGRSTRPW